MPGWFVINRDIRPNIIYLVTLQVSSQLDQTQIRLTLVMWNFPTVQIGMQQQKLQYVIELILEYIQLTKNHAEKIIALDFATVTWEKLLRKLSFGFNDLIDFKFKLTDKVAKTIWIL